MTEILGSNPGQNIRKKTANDWGHGGDPFNWRGIWWNSTEVNGWNEKEKESVGDLFGETENTIYKGGALGVVSDDIWDKRGGSVEHDGDSESLEGKEWVDEPSYFFVAVKETKWDWACNDNQICKEHGVESISEASGHSLLEEHAE